MASAIQAKVIPFNQTIRTSISSNNGTQSQVKTVAVGSPTTFGEISDIDVSELTDGAIPVYDESLGIFKVRAELDNEGTIINGGKY